jgi:hypothetical protein
MNETQSGTSMPGQLPSGRKRLSLKTKERDLAASMVVGDEPDSPGRSELQVQKVYFNNPEVVLKLSQLVTREVRSWGDEIKLSAAQTIVSRMFGYEWYDEVLSSAGLGLEVKPDRFVDDDERARRFEQYVFIMSENDFSREEAAAVISKIEFKGWWGFGITRGAKLSVEQEEIKASPNKMQFRDLRTTETFRKALKKGIGKLGINVAIGPRHLMAKVFGFDTFAELQKCAGHGVPAPSDWYVAPIELDRRVRGYLDVLRAAGLSESHAIWLLCNVSAGDWWGIEQDEWQQTPRQATHADRVEGSGQARWRPRRVRHSDMS